MKTTLALFLATVLTASAQTYLEMTEVVSNAMEQTPVYICVPVADQAEAETLKAQYAADEDLFKDLEYTAVFHTHKHRPQTEPCEVTPLKHSDMSKYVELESDETDRFNLPIKFRLPVIDKQDADRKAKKVKDMFKDKTFKVKEHGVNA